LPSALHDAPRNALLSEVFAAILPALAAVLERFAADGLAPFSERWWDVHRFAQRAVSIIDNGEAKLSGTAVGIDQYGRLLIDASQSTGTGTGTGNDAPALVTVTAGDVSLRLANAAVGETHA
jgi:BirA family biotin operon repressor/biotin-[acetyl-CoA-carboxylase] ligase